MVQFQVNERDQHDGSTCSSRPRARIERCIASSARTTAIPSGAPVNGCFPDTMHSRKCAHCAASGSPTATLGTITSPLRMLAWNEAKESMYVGRQDTSVTCLLKMHSGSLRFKSSNFPKRLSPTTQISPAFRDFGHAHFI